MHLLDKPSRREFLLSTTTAAAAASLGALAPSTAVGRNRDVAPNDKITLGVIGIGPRCTYDLKAMLPFDDVQCVAIADVQASRRDAGKTLVDGHYGNSDCVLYRDFRELLDRKDIDAVLIATGDRWHAAASILAAQAGKDVYSEKPCGITIADCQELADTMHREKRVFQAGTQRRSVPNFQKAVELRAQRQARQAPHAARLGLHARARQHLAARRAEAAAATWSTGTCGSAPRPGGPYNQKYVEGGWRGHWDFDSGARLLDWGRPHGRPLPVGQPGRRHDADRVRADRQEHRLPVRQRREAGPRLPADAVRRSRPD